MYTALLSFTLVSYTTYREIGESWSRYWSCVAEKMKFGQKKDGGHLIGLVDGNLNVGHVVGTQLQLFSGTN